MDTYIDPILVEIRTARDQHAAQFDYDPQKIFEDLQQREIQAKHQGVWFVTLPPKHPQLN